MELMKGQESPLALTEIFLKILPLLRRLSALYIFPPNLKGQKFDE